MNKLIYALCVFMVLGLVACSKPSEPMAEKADETVVLSQIDINDINNYYIVLNGKRFEIGCAVQDILGEGFTMGEVDEDGLAELFYDGEEIGTLSVSDNETLAGFATFSDLMITGATFSTINGVTFGMSRQEIESIFGITEDILEEGEEYELRYYDDEINKGYSFWFTDGKVEVIQIFVY